MKAKISTLAIKFIVVIALLCITIPVYCQNLESLINQAFTATGKEYNSISAQIVDYGVVAVPILEKGAKSDNYRERFIAEALIARIQRPDDYLIFQINNAEALDNRLGSRSPHFDYSLDMREGYLGMYYNRETTRRNMENKLLFALEEVLCSNLTNRPKLTPNGPLAENNLEYLYSVSEIESIFPFSSQLLIYIKDRLNTQLAESDQKQYYTCDSVIRVYNLIKSMDGSEYTGYMYLVSVDRKVPIKSFVRNIIHWNNISNLGWFTDKPFVFDVLCDIYYSNQPSDYRVQALLALCKSADPRVSKILDDAKHDKDELVKMYLDFANKVYTEHIKMIDEYNKKLAEWEEEKKIAPKENP